MNHYYAVDAFTSQPRHGNPAAVCLLDGPHSTQWMQAVAARLGQPSTAFVHTDDGRRRLRWFTPTTELPLCGHATIAAAHVLYEHEVDRNEQLRFDTVAGELRVWNDGDVIWLDLTSVDVDSAAPRRDVLAALGVAVDTVAWFGGNQHDYVVVLDDPRHVEELQPDFPALRALPRRRTIVTAAGGVDADFTSRVFTPQLGVDEDAVTGSAHAVLGPLWARRTGAQPDGGGAARECRFRAVQASARRGVLSVVVRGERTHVGGRAVTVSARRAVQEPDGDG